jgi:hypothetical protein
MVNAHGLLGKLAFCDATLGAFALNHIASIYSHLMLKNTSISCLGVAAHTVQLGRGRRFGRHIFLFLRTDFIFINIGSTPIIMDVFRENL